MGKVDLQIMFHNNPTATYWPGQVVQGSVLVNVTKENLELIGVRAKFKGKADVEWSTGSGDDKKTYSAKEEYFKEKVLLFGKLAKETSDSTELPLGEHFFPFQCQLPAVLPSSFEGEHGNIRYTIEVIVEKPGWSFNITKTENFTVIGHTDLNQQPDAMCEVQNSDEKTLCCFWCASGPISATIRVPRKGYVAGDVLRVYAEMQNLSDRNMSKCYIQLLQTTEFITKSSTNKADKEIARIQGPHIPPGESHLFNGDRLTIPPGLVPSFLQNCSIIDVYYYLKAVIVPSGPSTKLQVPVDILIGTIPHRLAVEGQGGGGGFIPPHPAGPPLPQQYGVPSAADQQYGVPSAPSQQYGVPSVPPPQYDDVMSSAQQYGVTSAQYGAATGGFSQDYGTGFTQDYGISGKLRSKGKADDQKAFDFSSAFDYGDNKK